MADAFESIETRLTRRKWNLGVDGRPEIDYEAVIRLPIIQLEPAK